MDLKSFWAYAIAWLIPFITGFVSKASLRGSFKFLITLGLSLVLALGTKLIDVYVGGGSWSALDVAFFISVFGEAEIIYRLFVKNMPDVKAWLENHGNKDSVPVDVAAPYETLQQAQAALVQVSELLKNFEQPRAPD